MGTLVRIRALVRIGVRLRLLAGVGIGLGVRVGILLLLVLLLLDVITNVGDESQRTYRRSGKEPLGVGREDGRPEVLARLPFGTEIQARTRGVEPAAAETELDLVGLRAAHPSHDDLSGLGRSDRYPPLGEIRLAAGTHPVGELARDLLGNPHQHIIPLKLARPAHDLARLFASN